MAISLMNFGFMQFLTDRFQCDRLQAEHDLHEQRERVALAEQHAQCLSQLLHGREDILRQLTLSNKSAGMGALVSGLAHETNQPLTTIVLKTELIDSCLQEPGIEPDERDDVLALFKSPRSRGMGVGLWPSQSVVKNHGGTLEFASTPGQGTVFVLQLPVNASVLTS